VIEYLMKADYYLRYINREGWKYEKLEKQGVVMLYGGCVFVGRLWGSVWGCAESYRG
jgi:hypothetical protein